MRGYMSQLRWNGERAAPILAHPAARAKPTINAVQKTAHV